MKTIIMLGIGFAMSITTVRAQTNVTAEFDVAEALFRHQFQHNASAVQTNAAAYFLSIRGQDPDPVFLKRFDGNTPPVKMKSEHGMNKKGVVVDPKSGRHALIFKIEGITMKSSDEAIVCGGYGEGPMSASGNTYILKKENGKWVVTSDKMRWISKTDTEPANPGYRASRSA